MKSRIAPGLAHLASSVLHWVQSSDCHPAAGIDRRAAAKHDV